MKIAIFSDFFYPEITGVTDSITLLGKTLAARGHTVMFVVPWYSKRVYAQAKIPPEKYDLGPNIIVKRLPSIKHPASSITKNGFIALPLGKGLYLMNRFKPDIIHTHSMYGPGIEAALYAKMTRTPLVGTNHTPVSEFMPGASVRMIRAALRYTSWYYNFCSFVSAPCQALLDEMKHYGLNAKQSPVPNPVELDKFAPAADEKEKADYKKKFGLSARAILYTGRLGPEKHIDVTLSAIAKIIKDIPDISFAITGGGGAEKNLRKRAGELGITDRVKFLGFLDEANFPLVYKASDIFVIMSTADTQSLSLMQAMASGLPSIVANSWGLPEYVGNSEKTNGIILESGDIDGLAKNLVELFNNPKKMLELGHAGTELVKQYSPDKIADRWEELYKIATIAK